MTSQKIKIKYECISDSIFLLLFRVKKVMRVPQFFFFFLNLIIFDSVRESVVMFEWNIVLHIFFLHV